MNWESQWRPHEPGTPVKTESERFEPCTPEAVWSGDRRQFRWSVDSPIYEAVVVSNWEGDEHGPRMIIVDVDGERVYLRGEYIQMLGQVIS